MTTTKSRRLRMSKDGRGGRRNEMLWKWIGKRFLEAVEGESRITTDQRMG